MKKTGRKATAKIVVVISFLTILFIVHIVQAASAEPGTEEDPLVTKSYVDDVLAQLMKELEGIKKENLLLRETVSKLSAVNSSQGDLGTDEVLEKTSTELNEINNQLELLKAGHLFKVLELEAGQKLLAGDSAEIIVRLGRASAVASGSGLIDISAGNIKDILSGQVIPNSHLLLAPVGDGRGIKAVSDKVIVLVRGKYTIE